MVMIRRFIIASLVLASLGLAIIGAMSFSRPFVTSIRITSRHWLTGAVYDGRARLFWLTTKDERILDVRRDKGARILITSTCYYGGIPGMAAAAFGHLSTPSTWINLGSRQDIPGFGGAFRSNLVVTAIQKAKFLGQGTDGDRTFDMTVPYPSAPPLVITSSYVRAPIAVLVAAMLIYPSLAYIRGPLRERRRRRAGCCLQCGYRLFALTGTKCPECGTDIPSTDATKEPSSVPVDMQHDEGQLD